MLNLASKIAQKVLSYFALHEGAELYVNEMARRLSVDQGNLDRKLKSLEKEGLLKSELKGRERYYSLNPSFPLLKEYKTIIKKTVGFEHLLRESLKEIKGLKAAWIFGSYAEDKMDSASDIDLLAIGHHDTIALQRKIAEIQKTMMREINVVSMTPDEYRTKKNDPFFRTIEKGKKIPVL